ncbi:MAG: ergothioneine biosynthesis protein EgtB [Gammaproteobacteria bacterium]|jgi:ergothioneine biosynthesis protein EgtB
MNTVTGNMAQVLQQEKRDSLAEEYLRVRSQTETLCQPLETDDYATQTMADVSPTKWHIAHVSWFFETFLLTPYLKNYKPFHPQYAHLFNSYYETVGTFHPRPQRGLLNRPTVKEIFQYRRHVDNHMQELLNQGSHADRADIQLRTRVGLNHEQQHQELMLTDIKHVFANNPLKPAYHNINLSRRQQSSPLDWLHHDGGLVETGYNGSGFCYDNELPVHKSYLEPFKVATRLVTNGEFMEFMKDNGYQRADLWLSDAWSTVQKSQWRAPLYWQNIDNEWWHMTLAGMQPVDKHAPVCHVSFFEADAFARWAGKRLPSEAEWEIIAKEQSIAGNLREKGILHPMATRLSDNTQSLQQMYGDVWEWTLSPYSPYPRFQPLPGSLGEYNGKFMCSQFVLRGGSCVTPQDHIRASYRNFFYPADRWQFSGLRLADDA